MTSVVFGAAGGGEDDGAAPLLQPQSPVTPLVNVWLLDVCRDRLLTRKFTPFLKVTPSRKNMT